MQNIGCSTVSIGQNPKQNKQQENRELTCSKKKTMLDNVSNTFLSEKNNIQGSEYNTSYFCKSNNE